MPCSEVPGDGDGVAVDDGMDGHPCITLFMVESSRKLD
jgi:hypothetical protein